MLTAIAKLLNWLCIRFKFRFFRFFIIIIFWFLFRFFVAAAALLSEFRDASSFFRAKPRSFWFFGRGRPGQLHKVRSYHFSPLRRNQQCLHFLLRHQRQHPRLQTRFFPSQCAVRDRRCQLHVIQPVQLLPAVQSRLRPAPQQYLRGQIIRHLRSPGQRNLPLCSEGIRLDWWLCSICGKQYQAGGRERAHRIGSKRVLRVVGQ